MKRLHSLVFAVIGLWCPTRCRGQAWAGIIDPRLDCAFRLDMRSLIFSILVLFLLPPGLWAANYTVKAGGGGNYTTIQSCATAMSAGDTCIVYAGTYNENVTVSSGTAGNYKTMAVNPGDTVYVYSFTINSHVEINGFYIQNPSSPTNAPCVSVVGNSTDYYVTNNNMYACSTALSEPANSSSYNTTYGYITGNTISYMCSTSSSPNVCRAMTINGDHHLIANNNISHVSDGPYVFGKYNILRGNTVGPTTDADCGSNSGNCHIDFMQADADVAGGTQPAEYLLMESNTVLNMVVTGAVSGAAAHGGPLLQAEGCNGECYNAIVRFHTAAHIYGGGTTNDNSDSTPPPAAWDNVKEYNNSWVDMLVGESDAGEGINEHSHGSSGASNVNEIYYFASADDTNQTNPYACLDTACTGYTYGHDLGFCTGTPCTLYGHTYGSGAFTSDPGNISADPLFVNYSANNFNLQSGSPAINAGTYLTTTTNSGSSTSLSVADVGFFQDNPGGLIGVQPDCLRIGASTTVCIAQGGINYSTNTITLATAATWTSGAGVYLYSDSSGTQRLFDSNGDIGAYQYQGKAPDPPTGVTAVAH